MAVMFLLVNWHLFIWKMGEVDMVCYIKVQTWFKKFVELIGGSITEEKAIKLLVHSNQRMF